MNSRKKILIAGAGGREAVFAQKLAEDSAVFAVTDHPNPSIAAAVETSGGEMRVANSQSPDVIVDFAVSRGVDYAFINQDNALANGVVDALDAAGIAAVGGSSAATRIEWDKVYSIDFVRQVAEHITPFYRVSDSADSLARALAEFADQQMEVVVKPQGLTGGKGVKVMPIHLPDYDAARDYARQLLDAAPAEKVLLVEKLHGQEFTVMYLTDGKTAVRAPATYDYPFRFANDTGPGTGGMGCCTLANGRLPFLSEQDMAVCDEVAQAVIDKMARDNLPFTGVLNGGFFKTEQGIRFMEFNARFGDPEVLNVLLLLETPLSDMIARMHGGGLSADAVRFAPRASVSKYLVAAEYPQASADAADFSVNAKAIGAQDISLFFGACVKNDADYRTLKKSRVLALAACGDKPSHIAAKINRAIDAGIAGALEYRADIGLDWD